MDIVKSKGSALQVRVDTKEQDIDEVLSILIKLGRVEDININETPLEEVISFIYNGKEGR